MNGENTDGRNGGFCERYTEKEKEKFMRAALKEAFKAGDAGEVPVGAVLVLSGKIVSRGKNERETKKRPCGACRSCGNQKGGQKARQVEFIRLRFVRYARALRYVQRRRCVFADSLGLLRRRRFAVRVLRHGYEPCARPALKSPRRSGGRNFSGRMRSTY